MSYNILYIVACRNSINKFTSQSSRQTHRNFNSPTMSHQCQKAYNLWYALLLCVYIQIKPNNSADKKSRQIRVYVPFCFSTPFYSNMFHSRIFFFCSWKILYIICNVYASIYIVLNINHHKVETERKTLKKRITQKKIKRIFSCFQYLFLHLICTTQWHDTEDLF